MKNGGKALLLLCVIALTLVLGMFVGRNLQSGYVMLPVNSNDVIDNKDIKDHRLDINTATKAQLMELPGIGELIAERILDYRAVNGPFATIDDLMNVEGIGQKKLLEVEALIKVGG